MVKLIVGEKGTGKTKRLVNDLNEMAQISENNVICIQNGDRLNNYIDTSIRLVNIEEYPVSNYSELIAFIAGINAKDYDLTHVYIDSIGKVVNGVDDQNELAKFLAALEGLGEQHHFDVEIMYSHAADDLTEELQKYVFE